MAHIRDFEPILPDPHPYVEKALALYERAVREKRGRIVFIAAELGGGKTEILNALAQALHQAKPEPNFVAGFFQRGDYHPHMLDWQERICLKKAVLAVGETAALLGLCPVMYSFAASFIGQFLQACASGHELSNEFKKQSRSGKEGRDWLRKILRRLAEEKPLVCLLDDWNEAQRFYWDDMLLSFSREIARDLPLLLVLTVKEPIDLAAPEKDESGLTMVIKSLIDKGLAERWLLRKLSRDEVDNTIGRSAPGIAAKLHGVTGGNARWVRELWREWRLNEIVVMSEHDNWVWGPLHTATLSLYDDILRDRFARLVKAEKAVEVDEAREILACAALEGILFTADALARALGWDRDELIDFLDERLVQSAENPDGLVLEERHVEISEPNGTTKTLWCYRFVSDLHWLALERYGFANEERPDKSNTEKQAKIETMINALQETYAPEERFAAAPLARLLRAIGQTEAARYYQRVANYSSRREVMREQGLYLLALSKDDWDQWACSRAGQFLIEVGEAMRDASPYDETRAVFEEAVRLAHRGNSEYDESRASNLCGYILLDEGDYKSARDSCNHAFKISTRIRNKLGIASSLRLQSLIDLVEGSVSDAHRQSTKALKISQEIGDQQGTAHSLLQLARIAHDESRYEEARRQASRSLKIYQQIGDRSGTADSLEQLARIDKAQGRYDEARRQATESLDIYQEINNRVGEADAMKLIATLDRSAGRYHDARGLATQSLKIFQELGDQLGMAISINLLAEIDFAEGRYEQARSQAKHSLRIYQEIGNQLGTAVSLDGLALIDYAEGGYNDALRRAERSLEIFQLTNHRKNTAGSLCKLGNIARKLRRPKEAFDLTTLGSLIFAELGDAQMQEAEADLADLVTAENYGAEQLITMKVQLLDAYRKDGGKELIENALASLREVDR